MKQSVTKEQWNELSFNQKHLFQWGRLPRENEVDLLKTELPNIGKMIEYLTIFEIIKYNRYWKIDDYVFEKTELCDALWECVKNRIGIT
jgi:hypothetical protein